MQRAEATILTDAEERVSEIFPFNEIKSVLEAHGFTVDPVYGGAYPGLDISQLTILLECPSVKTAVKTIVRGARRV